MVTWLMLWASVSQMTLWVKFETKFLNSGGMVILEGEWGSWKGAVQAVIHQNFAASPSTIRDNLML